jgi:hypothetical protein
MISKKKKNKRPNARVFVKSIASFGKYPNTSCCPAIAFDAGGNQFDLEFFRILFGGQSNGCFWWPRGDSGVRVIALQLAACVAKDNAL